MAEDKRVRKTKRAIKQALAEALEDKPFEQITVTQLCAKADISRITFYAHYSDKFALADEMVAEMLSNATADYRAMQEENNPGNDTVQTFCNLLDCILNLYNNHLSLLTHTTIDQNPYLYHMFYHHIVRSVEQVLLHRGGVIRPRYSIKQVSGFICNSLWAFLSEAQREGGAGAATRRDAKRVLAALLEADIVTEMAPPGQQPRPPVDSSHTLEYTGCNT